MSIPQLHDVAAIYLRATEHGDHPTKAVADHFGKPRSTAARWVAKCRESDLLAPASPGEHARTGPRVVAVAVALGVEPSALEEAVRTHANGRLTVS